MTAQEIIDTVTETARIGSGDKNIDLSEVRVLMVYADRPGSDYTGPMDLELYLDRAKWDNKEQTVILNLEY
jgi:hypothetical protein